MCYIVDGRCFVGLNPHILFRSGVNTFQSRYLLEELLDNKFSSRAIKNSLALACSIHAKVIFSFYSCNIHTQPFVD